jgi:hypothetical protein
VGRVVRDRAKQHHGGAVNVGRAKVAGQTARVRVACTGAAGAKCSVALSLSVTEHFRGHKLIAVTARHGRSRKDRVVTIGTASVRLDAGGTRTVRVTLNRQGRQLLAARRVIRAELRVTQALGSHHDVTVSTQTVTFRARHHGHRSR